MYHQHNHQALRAQMQQRRKPSKIKKKMFMFYPSTPTQSQNPCPNEPTIETAMQ